MSPGSPLRSVLRRLHRLVRARLVTPLGEDELHRPAMVFAPHPDDETLGCGGTILRKREAGADVQVVFVTDGTASHGDLVSPGELAATREREAREAAQALGVEAPHVFWLGFPDGALAEHHAAAVSRVAELLEQHRPRQLFVPYARREHPDHVATNAIVREAAARVGLGATLFEYPVWLWLHWLNTGFGLRLLAEFRTAVPIGELLEQKRAALARHASQVERRNADARWHVLGDIAGGDFLACFFQEHELYRRVELLPGRVRVLFVAWFLNEKRRWLGEFLDPARFECDYVGLGEPMDVTRQRAGIHRWWQLFRLAVKARRRLAAWPADLIVTAFPQGGFTMALLNLLTLERTPHVIWYFNCGHEYRGLRRFLSRIALRSIARCAVYTRHERSVYSRVFTLPEERFQFTYLTGTELDPGSFRGARERFGLPSRYVVALGSSQRDWDTFFQAMAGLDVQTVVVTHPHSLRGVQVPPDARVLTSIPQADYLRVLCEAELAVIPVNNVETASGQMTLIQAMWLGVPVVATRCIGTEDYIQDGENGLFVEMGDAHGMRRAICSLLEDPERRRSLAERAHRFAQEHFSDQAGARVLASLAWKLYSARGA